MANLEKMAKLDEAGQPGINRVIESGRLTRRDARAVATFVFVWTLVISVILSKFFGIAYSGIPLKIITTYREWSSSVAETLKVYLGPLLARLDIDITGLSSYAFLVFAIYFFVEARVTVGKEFEVAIDIWDPEKTKPKNVLRLIQKRVGLTALFLLLIGWSIALLASILMSELDITKWKIPDVVLFVAAIPLTVFVYEILASLWKSTAVDYSLNERHKNNYKSAKLVYVDEIKERLIFSTNRWALLSVASLTVLGATYLYGYPSEKAVWCSALVYLVILTVWWLKVGYKSGKKNLGQIEAELAVQNESVHGGGDFRSISGKRMPNAVEITRSMSTGRVGSHMITALMISLIFAFLLSDW